MLISSFHFRKDSSEPERKSIKISPSKQSPPKESPKLNKEASQKTPKVEKKPAKKTPKAKTPKAESSKKAAVKTEIKSESPENKPLNGQSKEAEVEEVAKDDGKTLQVKSAGAGQAGADYNPSRKNYHPVNHAFWKKGEK